ncbi:MAG: hypothetical protein GC168_14505 [Candidatus Hydrogenedens sp.]|nr:hypothetical protein [Candidatus Hydrogenedens sp.]
MSDKPVQNLSNHGHTPKELIIECVLILPVLLGAGFAAFKLLAGGDELNVPLLVVAIALLLHAAASIYVVLHLRFACLKLQDRLIRQEMRFRLSQVLPDDLRGRIGELDLGQLVSLRFAGDDEIVDITRKVLNDKIGDRKAIKKMVKNWQADWMRI